MIFLAVTHGFFAESYREHIADKNRIHDYMQEMVENLEYDSLRCAINYEKNIVLEKGMDSLRAEIKQGINGNINSNALYYYSFQYLGTFSHAAFNNSAISELKNSGSFRLIENKDLTAEIYDYYQRKLYAADSHLPTTAEIDEAKKIGNEFFSLSGIDNYVESYDSITAKTFHGNYNYQNLLQYYPPLQLLKKDPADLERLYTDVAEYEIKLKVYNFWLLYCKEANEKLINDIKKNII